MSEDGQHNVLLGGEAENIGGRDTDFWLYSYQDRPHIILQGADWFESNCILVLAGDVDAVDYPMNTYSTDYPYCRTAIRVSMDDYAPSPLFGSVRQLAAIIVVRIALTECQVPVAATHIHVEPPPGSSLRCGAAGFVSPDTGYAYLLVDTSQVLLPVMVQMTLTSASGLTRTGAMQILRKT